MKQIQDWNSSFWTCLLHKWTSKEWHVKQAKKLIYLRHWESNGRWLCGWNKVATCKLLNELWGMSDLYLMIQVEFDLSNEYSLDWSHWMRQPIGWWSQSTGVLGELGGGGQLMVCSWTKSFYSKWSQLSSWLIELSWLYSRLNP